MNFNAGYCSNQGYGFIKKINDEKKFSENILVKNYNNQPPIHGYFYNTSAKYNTNYLILIGAQPNQLNLFIEEGYKPVKKYNDCYLIVKK